MANRQNSIDSKQISNEMADFVKANYSSRAEAREVISLANEIMDLANSQEYLSLTDEQIKARSASLKERIQNGAKPGEIEAEAFALVITATDRVLHKRQFATQILGGLSIQSGHIAEMGTGEGKTLASLMPIYLQALSGQVHIATSREELAIRDCLGIDENGQRQACAADVLRYLGLNVGITLSDTEFENLQSESQDAINFDNNFDAKVAAYQADVVYGTTSEFAFDYLKNNMAKSKDAQIAIPPRSTMLLDEADFTLIDGQSNPFVISPAYTHDTRNPVVLRGLTTIKTLREERDKVKEAMLKANATSKEIAEAQSQFYSIDPATLELSFGPKGHEFLLSVYGSEDKIKANTQFLNDLVREDMVVDSTRRADQFAVRLKTIVEELRNQYLSSGKSESEVDDLIDNIIEINPDTGVSLGPVGDRIASDFYGSSSIDPSLSLEDIDFDPTYDFVNDQMIQEYHFIQNALIANFMFEEGKQYIVEDGKIVVIDSTGTKQPSHRFSNGLHQALEAKHGLELSPESDAVAKITVPAFLNLYRGFSGMTGTAFDASKEFASVYDIDINRIPRLKGSTRKDVFKTFETKQEKLNAILDYVLACQKTGQPVLLGTTSVEESREFDRLLAANNIPHEVLNAEKDNASREKAIIAKAGKKGAVTIATAMAGRGTDISLGGGDKAEKAELEQKGGLMVILTQLSASERTAEQLRGRAGRFGDVGTTITCASLEDEVVITYCKQNNIELEGVGPKKMQRIIQRAQHAAEVYDKKGRENAIKVDKAYIDQMNIIYGIRQDILDGNYFRKKVGDNYVPDYTIIDEWVADYMSSRIATAIDSNTAQGDIDMVKLTNDLKLARVLPASASLEEFTDQKGQNTVTKQELQKAILNMGYENYDQKKEEQLKSGTFEDKLQRMMINSIDKAWTDHIYGMEQIKSQLFTRTFGSQNFEDDYRKICYTEFNQNVVDRIMEETSYELLKPTPAPARRITLKRSTERKDL